MRRDRESQARFRMMGSGSPEGFMSWTESRRILWCYGQEQVVGLKGLHRDASLWLLIWLKTNYAFGHLLYTILSMPSSGLHGHRTVTLEVQLSLQSTLGRKKGTRVVSLTLPAVRLTSLTPRATSVLKIQVFSGAGLQYGCRTKRAADVYAKKGKQHLQVKTFLPWMHEVPNLADKAESHIWQNRAIKDVSKWYSSRFRNNLFLPWNINAMENMLVF